MKMKANTEGSMAPFKSALKLYFNCTWLWRRQGKEALGHHHHMVKGHSRAAGNCGNRDKKTA